MRSLSKRRSVLFMTSIVLISFFLAAGCAVSKKAYEDRMVSILSEVKADLGKNHKELAKVEIEKDSKQRDQKRKVLIEEQIEILEKTRDEIKNVSAPDDVYGGHSDMIEFLQLLIKSREATLKSIGKKESAKSSKIDSDAFKEFQYSGRAFARASSELPFLEFELRDTFETVLQDVQMDIQKRSGFESNSSPGATDGSKKKSP